MLGVLRYTPAYDYLTDMEVRSGLVILGVLCFFLFFFKQKTAYEIKECDWSSDVCSSDLNEIIQEIFYLILIFS